jgi:hypothetical protein
LPILFTHLLSGLAAVALMLAACRRSRPSAILLGWAAFAFIMPDLDHLLIWAPSMAGKILPSSLQDLAVGLFGPRIPSMLHCWLLPALLVPPALALRHRGCLPWGYLAAAAFGWSVHLILDGVLLY